MLRSTDERQQIDGFGQVVGGVVADFEHCDPPDEKRVVRWNFAMEPNIFISAQHRPSRALSQVCLDLQSGRRLANVLGLFHALIHELDSNISLVLTEVGAKLNEMEERLLDQKEVGSDVLGQARRRLVHLRRQAVPLRALLIHMVAERPDWIDSDAVVDCQAVAARMDGLVDDLESLQERAHTLQDELKAREAEKTKGDRDPRPPPARRFRFRAGSRDRQWSWLLRWHERPRLRFRQRDALSLDRRRDGDAT
jgi:Mg2+ and Co2+ transporter CorA